MFFSSYQVVDERYELDVVVLHVCFVIKGKGLESLVNTVRFFAHAKQDVRHYEALLDSVLFHLLKDLGKVLEVFVLSKVRCQRSVSGKSSIIHSSTSFPLRVRIRDFVWVYILIFHDLQDFESFSRFSALTVNLHQDICAESINNNYSAK